jgi:hypothetical protein
MDCSRRLDNRATGQNKLKGGVVGSFGGSQIAHDERELHCFLELRRQSAATTAFSNVLPEDEHSGLFVKRFRAWLATAVQNLAAA